MIDTLLEGLGLKKKSKRKFKKVSSGKRSSRSIKADKKRTAKKPGKRVSASGNVYYESRANRSDKDRRKRL